MQPLHAQKHPQNTPQNAATPHFFEFLAFTPPQFADYQLIPSYCGENIARKQIRAYNFFIQYLTLNLYTQTCTAMNHL
jgi:hypothetical protein